MYSRLVWSHRLWSTTSINTVADARIFVLMGKEYERHRSLTDSRTGPVGTLVLTGLSERSPRRADLSARSTFVGAGLGAAVLSWARSAVLPGTMLRDREYSAGTGSEYAD